jgi:hypothetical protein
MPFHLVLFSADSAAALLQFEFANRQPRGSCDVDKSPTCSDGRKKAASTANSGDEGC